MDTGTVVGVVGATIAVMGIAATFAVYYLTKKEKKPCWSAESTAVLTPRGDLLADLEVTYRQDPITRLSITWVVFWNAGREAILTQDVARLNPLRIEVAESETVRLLDAVLMASSRPGCGFSIPAGGNSNARFIRFEFVNRGDWCLVQVVHTGLENDVSVVGDLVNAPPIHEIGPMRTRGHRLADHAFQALSLIAGLSVVLLLLDVFGPGRKVFPMPSSAHFTLAAAGLLIVAGSLIAYASSDSWWPSGFGLSQSVLKLATESRWRQDEPTRS